ncbi:MAG: SIMPL domain-containing protein [Rhizobiales bacterium]|nr:SIMPL domain-containing protein [Hyphomicrobiales bacterium]
MNKNNFVGLVFAGALLSIGIAASGFFISQTIYKSKVGINIAEAKGLAERRVTSDRANWEIRFLVSGGADTNIANLYKRYEASQQTIVKALKKVGFADKEITLNAAKYRGENFRNDANIIVDKYFSLSGGIEIDTDKVALVGSAQTEISKLIAEGISLDSRPPSYKFTKLNEIKPEMLKEATRNARIAAMTFAENVGAKVGGIRSARQGGFNIVDAGAEYGDRNKIEKDVRVVTTVSFYIEN